MCAVVCARVLEDSVTDIKTKESAADGASFSGFLSPSVDFHSKIGRHLEPGFDHWHSHLAPKSVASTASHCGVDSVTLCDLVQRIQTQWSGQPKSLKILFPHHLYSIVHTSKVNIAVSPSA